MKLQDQLVNLELSKQLKKCGYKQEGLWWWLPDSQKQYNLGTLKAKEGFKSLKWFADMVVYVAPTVAELGEALSEKFYCYTVKDSGYSKAVKGEKGKIWLAKICDRNGGSRGNAICSFYATNEANARAKMYIYLQKEGLI